MNEALLFPVEELPVEVAEQPPPPAEVCQIKIGKRTFTVLFPDLLRPLTESELVALRKSVRARGVLVPIVADEADGVIDDANRLRIEAEVGLVAVPVEVCKGFTPEMKLKAAFELNDARRHLTHADRKQVKVDRQRRVAELRQQGSSLRTIAEKEGVSLGQVQRDLEPGVSEDTPDSGAVEPAALPAKVQGRDGKAYPKRRVPVEPATDEPRVIANADHLDANDVELDKPVVYQSEPRDETIAQVEVADSDAPAAIVTTTSPEPTDADLRELEASEMGKLVEELGVVHGRLRAWAERFPTGVQGTGHEVPAVVR